MKALDFTAALWDTCIIAAFEIVRRNGMILYFTGTGNSRYIARAIAEATGDSLLSVNERLKRRKNFIRTAAGGRRSDLRMAYAKDRKQFHFADGF